MISAEIAGSVIALESDYDLRDRDRIKELPGARYNMKTGWTVPLTWATCQQLRGVFGNELAVGPDLTTWSVQEFGKKVGPAMSLRDAMELTEPDPIIERWRTSGETKPLYPFQEAGVKFLVTTKYAYLCDEMGTGKTIQAASALRYMAEAGDEPFPALIVVKASLLIGWKRELAKWLPGRSVAVVKGSAAERRKILEEKHDVYLITPRILMSHSRLAPYGSMRLRRCHVCDKSLVDAKEFSQAKCEHCKKEANLIPWHTIIVDEAHMLQDPKAKQTRAVWAARTEATKAVFLMTGTPISSAPHNMWTGLHMLYPEAFSNRDKYITRYCATSYNPFGGVNIIGLNPMYKDEFFRIIDPMMRRMPKEAVLPFLPKKNYIRRYLDMPAKQAKAYAQMKKGLMAALDGGTLLAENGLTQATRLDQMAQACLEIVGDEIKMLGPSSKMEGLLELLEDMGDEPLVVFSQHRELADLALQVLTDRKISHTEIVGGLTPDQVDKAVQDFQTGKVRVIVCTTGAGAVGLTLTRAGTIAFLQRPWSMIASKQSEDRVHRIGSEIHDKITVVDLISTGTTDEKKLRMLADKGDRMEEILRDQKFLKWLLEEGTDEDTNQDL